MAQQVRQLLVGRAGWVASGLAAALIVPGVAMADKASDEEKALREAEKRRDRQAKAMFDPEALERGAKALRDINNSPHAKQV